MILVTDSGFAPDDFAPGFVGLEAAVEGAGIDLDPGVEPADHRAVLLAAPAIRVRFPGFADGRGFTVARMLRLMGYRGRLRAGAGLIADQYAMARRAGFDEVELDEALAARQPEAVWLARADWRAWDHRSHLGRFTL